MSSSDFPPARDLRIVQCARDIGPGFGVSGPAFRLEEELTRLGCTCTRFTLADLGIRRTGWRAAAQDAGGAVRAWRDVVAFSVMGSVVLWRRYRRRDRRTIVLCHVDALYGDVFVVRSLQKSFFSRGPGRWWWCLRNPLHLLVLARDEIRFRSGIHRHIIALSETNKAEIVRLYGIDESRITVIPNGVDTTRFRPDPAARAAVRRALQIPDDAWVVLFVGNEFARKGLEPLLGALQLMAREGTACHAIVAGGDSADALRERYAELATWVRFVGHRQDVERYYASGDAFVLPAAFDVSPLVGREALAAGLPLLMTDVGDVREYLREGETGYFITREPAQIAASIQRLRADPDRVRRMSARARESVADADWSLVARQYLEVLARLAEHEAPAAAPAPVS